VYVNPIKAMIEENPAFGYRTVAYLLGMNKNTVKRVFQLMNWQVRKRPVQNGIVERVIRTLKEQCVHRHRFETIQHASQVIADWILFYNTQRPHQALGMRTPAEQYQLAA